MLIWTDFIVSIFFSICIWYTNPLVVSKATKNRNCAG
jgi:hypothetical protein